MLAAVGAVYWFYQSPEEVFCTMDAKQCPDGSYVLRIPPDCEFSICPGEWQGILISSPKSNEEIESPLKIEGKARGTWFFEATFPVVLTDWDGRIIAQTYVQAQENWMTEEFVPFVAEVEFESPYKEGDPDFMKRATLIFQKANPSGLPENYDVIEIQLNFK